MGSGRSPRPLAQGTVPARACLAHSEHLHSQASFSPSVTLVIAQPVCSPFVMGAASSHPVPRVGGSSMDSRTGLCRSLTRRRSPSDKRPQPRPLGHSHQCGQFRKPRLPTSRTWESGLHQGPEQLQRKFPVSSRHPAYGILLRSRMHGQRGAEIWAAVHRVMPG